VSDENDDGDNWDGDDQYGSSWNTGHAGGAHDTQVAAAPLLVIPRTGSAIAPPSDSTVGYLRQLNGYRRY
jgi:hypothetical protein